MSRVEEYERCPFFPGNPMLANRQGITELFRQSPYYEPSDQNTIILYEVVPQHEDASGQAQAYIVFKFEQRDRTRSLKRVYYVTGQLVDNTDQCKPGLIFPLPDLYHTLLTKFTLAVDCVSAVCDNIRLSLDIQQEAENKIEAYNASLAQKNENTNTSDPATSNTPGAAAKTPLFRREEESPVAVYVLNNTIKNFDFGADFDWGGGSLTLLHPSTILLLRSIIHILIQPTTMVVLIMDSPLKVIGALLTYIPHIGFYYAIYIEIYIYYIVTQSQSGTIQSRPFSGSDGGSEPKTIPPPEDPFFTTIQIIFFDLSFIQPCSNLARKPIDIN